MSPSPERTSRRAGVHRWWPVAVLVLACAWFWPVLGHGFRSDDFLAVYYLDRDDGSVRWERVLEEWLRPWFGVRDLYRPLVSLSYGVNWTCGTSPFGFHAVNLLLLAGTALAVAAAAARLVPARAALAGLLAGAVVVLHPAAVEPTAWVAARTTGLQVFWSAVGYWAFLRWRDGAGGRALPLLATVLACASKEGAVLLPASFVVLDLLRGDRPRLRVHLPFAGVVVGYLAFRWWLLGVVTTAGPGQSLLERGAVVLQLVDQLARSDRGVVGAASLAVLGLAAFVACRRALWCLPWALLLLAPGTTHVQGLDSVLAGRFLFDAVPALALLTALAAAGAAGRVRWVVWPAAATAVGAALSGSRVELQHYGQQDGVVQAVAAGLRHEAAAAGPGRPFGVVGLPQLPLLQPGLWGALGLQPFAPRDLAVVGLDRMLTPDAGGDAFGDAAPVHALAAAGAGFARWDPATASFARLPAPSVDTVEFVADARHPGRFVPDRLLSPLAVAAIEIRVPTPVGSWRAEVVGNLAGVFAAPSFERTAAPPATVWWLDTTVVLPWLVAASLGGGPAGIDLACDGAPPPPGTRVLAHARLATLSAATWGGDAALPRHEWLARLVPPDTGEDGAWSCYLLLPTGVHMVPVEAGQPFRLDAATRAQLDFTCDVLGPCSVHWFWQRRGGSGPPARSGLGCCRLE